MFLCAGNRFINLAQVSHAEWLEDEGELILRVGATDRTERLSGDEAIEAREVLGACLVRVAPAEVETD